MPLPLWALIVATMCSCGISAKVGQASRQLERFDSGDRAAIHQAHSDVEVALSKDRGRLSAEAWCVRGQIFLEYLTHPDLDPPNADQDPATEATLSFEKATALQPTGAVHAALSGHVPELEGTLTARLVNEMEANRLEDAAKTLDLALRTHEAGTRVGGRAAHDGARLEALAVEVLANTGQAEQAAEHYATLHARTQQHDSALAGYVARALAATDVSAGLAFIEPIAAQTPADEVLLRTEVALLVQADRAPDAASRVEQAYPTLRGSPSGAFLAGVLFHQAKNGARAREAWSGALQLDPSHMDAHLELGRSLATLAADVQQRVESSDNIESPLADEEILLLADDLDDLWGDAIEHLDRAHELEPSDPDPLRVLIQLYDDKLGEVDIERLRGWRRRAHRADMDRRDQARSALGALEQPR